VQRNVLSSCRFESFLVGTNMYEVYIDDVYLPTHEQLKRISSTNILRWEPIQKEKDIIKSTWNDDFK
jgi:hypothetical protein